MSDALTEALAQLQAEAEERRTQRASPSPRQTEPQPQAQQPSPRSGQPETFDSNRSRPGTPFDILRAATLPFVNMPQFIQQAAVTRGASRGVVKGANEITDLAAEVGTGLGDAAATPQVLDALNPGRDDFGGMVGRNIIRFSRAARSLGFGENEAPDIPLPFDEPDTFEGRAAEGVAQTITGYLAGGRVLKMLRVPQGASLATRFGRAAAQGAIGDYIAFDGNDARLSNLIESVPQLRNPVTAFLAADAEDDELTGRLKNVLEGLGVGVLAESFVTVLRGTKALAKGDQAGAEAAADALEQEVATRAAATAQARGAAQAAPQRGLLSALVDDIRQRLSLGSMRKPQDLAAFKRDAGNRAAASVDVTGLSAQEAAAKQQAARVEAERVAEQEFKRQSSAGPNSASSQSSGSAGARGSDGGERTTGQAPPEVPEGVLSKPDDVQGLLDEIEGNRARSGDLNVKPDSEPDLTRTHGEWTLNTFGTPEKLDATLRSLVERTAPKTTRSDAELHAAALSAADELGQTADTALAAGMHIAGIAGNIDTAVQTMRVLWKRTTAEVDAHVGRDIAQATPDEFANIVRSIHNALTFSNYMAQVKSAMGRGLRVFQLPDADTYARLVAEGDPTDALRGADRSVIPLPRTREEASDWLELWGLTRDNPQARADFLEGMQALPDQWKYLRNSFANLFTANVLSGLPSVMLNVVGPSTIGALRTLEKTTGGYMASLLPWIPKERRAALRSSATNAMVAYTQAMGDIRDVFKYAMQAVGEGRSILGGGGSVSDRAAQFGPITEGMLRAQGIEPGFGYWAGNVLNMWPSAFSRLNNGLDEFSKRLSFLGEVRARALITGAEQGHTGQTLIEFVSQRVRASTDDVGAAVDEDMLRAAERTTFTGSPGAEGSKARALSNLINDWRANTPEIRYVLPIFNVPANALGETLTRVPVLNYALKETREALLGNRGALEQAEAHGRMLLGAGMLTAGFYLARSGQITGAGPESPTDRKLWLQTHQPYSIRIGDQWVDYSRYDILGSLLGIPATVFDETVYRRQDLGLFDLMAGAAGALSEFFREKAALQTASDLLSFGERGQSEQVFFERLFGGTSGRLVTPNWVTQLGRKLAGDTEARTKTSMWGYAMDLIPGLSSTLDPQRNIWGEPIHRPKDSFFENIAPITMTSASSYENDPQTDELERLYSTTGYAAGVSAQDDISGGFYDAREVMLEDGHSLYDAIIRARATVEVDGLTLRQAMQELFDSADYADAVDADASNRETSNGDTSRGYLVSRVFSDFHEAAKQAVAQESETAARYLAVTAAKRTDDATLRGYSADELARTQGLAEALGIDLESYVERARGE